jgi:hypothetical protein
MTKVFLKESVLKYRREMAERVRETIKEKYIAGVRVWSNEEPPLAQVDLLCPPKIEMIDLMIYEGKVHDLILLVTSDDFGIWNLHVTIMDDKGNVIESGNAFQESDDGLGIWDYFTKVSVLSGTPVIAHATATDRLGGVGTLSADTTIP